MGEYWNVGVWPSKRPVACPHGHTVACRRCWEAGLWPPGRHMPKPCLIRWNPRSRLWHGTAFGLMATGTTVAGVYGYLEAMVRRRNACFAYTVIRTDPAECSGTLTGSKPHGL